MVILPYAESLIFRRAPSPFAIEGRVPKTLSPGPVSNIFPVARNRDSVSARDGQAGKMRSAFGDAAAVVADAVDRAGIIVRHQQRAVLEHLHVYRAADIVVVLQEAGHERLPGFHAAIGVELHDDDIAAELGGLVPRAVAGDEDRIAIGSRKHLAGVKAHAERGRMRTEQRNRRLEVAAAAPPAELVVGHIALVTIGIAEMLPSLGDAVELVVGQILR